jgi:hypothetical protein
LRTAIDERRTTGAASGSRRNALAVEDLAVPVDVREGASQALLQWAAVPSTRHAHHYARARFIAP